MRVAPEDRVAVDLLIDGHRRWYSAYSQALVCRVRQLILVIIIRGFVYRISYCSSCSASCVLDTRRHPPFWSAFVIVRYLASGHLGAKTVAAKYCEHD
jgi:hypothetical protein